MAERKRGSYSPEFRQKAADLAIASDVHLGDIAKTLNVVPSTLSNWVARRRKQLESAIQPKSEIAERSEQLPLARKQSSNSSLSEIEILKKEIQKLRQERKVVKEAILLLTT